jgi:capsular exopolysaccharide synthesis family protein
MLQISPHAADVMPPELELPHASPTRAGIEEVVRFLRRRRTIIGVAIATTLLLASGYAMFATPRYTALTSLLIDARKASQATILGDPIIDSAIVESQVEVIRSQTVARSVIAKLDLTADDEFNRSPRWSIESALQGIVDIFRQRFPAGDAGEVGDQKLTTVVRAFEKKLEVHRVGLSYVLMITFSSNSPAKAARIANAVTDAYFAEVLAAKFDSSEKANVWLRQQMEEFRSKAAEATERLQQFKAQTELVDNDRGAIENTAKLRDLETVAQSYLTIYSNFVQRYAETLQNSSPTIEARVITQATAPDLKAWPKLMVVVLAAALFGSLMGALIGLIQDRSDRTFRCPVQIEAALGGRFLGVLPMCAGGRRALKLRDVAERELTAITDAAMSHVLDAPLARFSETVRSVRVAIDVRNLSRDTKVIGVTSTLPGEGKTTTAFNLALLSARTGTRTLFIDANPRNARLTEILEGQVPAHERPVVESATVEHDVLTAYNTEFKILPAPSVGHTPQTDKLLLREPMQDLLTKSREDYDLIIVDLPPIAPTADVRMPCILVDALLFVLEWGKTPRDLAAEALASLGVGSEQLLGILLNKVDTTEYRRFNSSASNAYYCGEYQHGRLAKVAASPPPRA